jgi:hypothetical protein
MTRFYPARMTVRRTVGRATRVSAALGFILVIANLVSAQTAQAAQTRYVDKTNPVASNDPPSDCTIPTTPCMTITYALSVAGAGDTISVAAGTYNYNPTPNLGEQFPLTIDKNLTLTGAGAGSTTINATGANQRVITINPGFTVTISGVTITRGISSAIGQSGSGPGGGGGIRNDGILNLDNSTVSNNSGGGGIFNSGTLTLTNSTVSDNLDAGGIFNMAKLALNNSIVKDNKTDGTGGGIYNYFGTLSLTYSTVIGNTARDIGGIRSTGGTMTLTNSTVSGNKAVGVNGGIGGITNECGTAILTNSTVSGNTAVKVIGGISNRSYVANYCVGNPGAMTLNNSTVSGNIAGGGDGGGIFNKQDSGSSGATVTLNNSTVSANSATGAGGGILNDGGAVMLKNSIVADNAASSGANCSGTINSLGLNLSNDNTCGIIGVIIQPPGLVPLALNAPGSTETHALCTGFQTPDPSCSGAHPSPAINQLLAAPCPVNDQRGVKRPQGQRCDIGAYEACVARPAYMVAWWPGDGNANDIVGGNPGTLENGATFALGMVGQAFSFALPNAHVRVPHQLLLNPSGSFTIDAWILPTIDTIGSIVTKWGDQGAWADQRAYAFHTIPGLALNFGISDIAHQTDTLFHTLQTPSVLTLNQWNHVAAVYDQSTGTRSIYVNGDQKASRTDPPMTQWQSIADVSIGAHLRSPAPGSIDAPFEGLIDEVEIFYAALSANEINAIFQAQGTGKCKP